MANYKPKKKKSPTQPNWGKEVPKSKMNTRAYWIIGLILLALIGMVLPRFMNSRAANEPTAEPQFVKEGTLTFINGNTGKNIQSIDIEVADDDAQRQQGLMWRKSMDNNQGMLFIMDEEEKQGFFMRNTYISLDIIFLDAKKNILNIHSNTAILNDRTLLSEGNAKYVVEVNGGYCQRNGITKGDKIAFEIF